MSSGAGPNTIIFPSGIDSYTTKIDRLTVVSGESHTIPLSPPYEFFLDWAPLQQIPTTTSIPGYTEVSVTPGSLQFQTTYSGTSSGLLSFNAANSGASVNVTYTAYGDIVRSEAINSMQQSLTNIETYIIGGVPVSGNFVSKNGDTMSGTLSLAGVGTDLYMNGGDIITDAASLTDIGTTTDPFDKINTNSLLANTITNVTGNTLLIASLFNGDTIQIGTGQTVVKLGSTALNAVFISGQTFETSVDMTPDASGTVNLGSIILPYDTVYANNLVTTGVSGTFVHISGDTMIGNLAMNAVSIIDSTSKTGGDASIAFGNFNVASGANSQAFGAGTFALGLNSHAEGNLNIASGNYSHAEGRTTQALGIFAHSEGASTKATGQSSHSEGTNTIAYGDESHVEGTQSVASGNSSHAEGFGTKAEANFSHSEGNGTRALGDGSHAEGVSTNARGDSSHTEGENNSAYEDASHAEGQSTIASGIASHAEGQGTRAYADGAHAEGQGNFAYGIGSHAEGQANSAFEDGSHAEGQGTIASGQAAHAEGQSARAYADGAHAEGQGNYAYGEASHAEGQNTVTYGEASHAEGQGSITYGVASHAQGENSIASGVTSFAHGYGALALHDNSIVFADSTGASSTNTDQFTMSFANGVVLAPNTNLYVSTSGLQDIGTPTEPLNAIYADNIVCTSGLGIYLQTAGGTMTGDIALDGAIISGNSVQLQSSIAGPLVSTVTLSGQNFNVYSFNPGGATYLNANGAGISMSADTGSGKSQVNVYNNLVTLSGISITTTGDILPSVSGVDDIGSLTAPYANAYIKDAYISNLHGMSPITLVDALQASGNISLTGSSGLSILPAFSGANSVGTQSMPFQTIRSRSFAEGIVQFSVTQTIGIDSVILANPSTTLVLDIYPTENGKKYTIIDISNTAATNNIIITGQGCTINGVGSATISTNRGGMTLYSYGGNYYKANSLS